MDFEVDRRDSRRDVLENTERWLTVVHRTGPDDVEATYRELPEGQANPAIGYRCSMSARLP